MEKLTIKKDNTVWKTRMHYRLREILAAPLVPFMVATGFRFDKTYRWGTTHAKRAIYALIDTIQANVWVGKVRNSI